MTGYKNSTFGNNHNNCFSQENQKMLKLTAENLRGSDTF